MAGYRLRLFVAVRHQADSQNEPLGRGVLHSLRCSQSIDDFRPPPGHETAGFDSLLIDQRVSNILVLSATPAQLAADVAVGHPYVTVLLTPPGKQGDHLLASKRKIIVV
jgi:hypothetical protein